MRHPMERFEVLFQGLLPDRVPIICNLMDQRAKETGLSIQDYYRSGEAVAEGQIKPKKKYGHDVLRAFFSTAHINEARHD